jgi:glyoxylase-like metal-dependent hydrolase (beta-lactamase superfamily II)
MRVANALPMQTFARDKKFQANGEAIELGSFPPAHTDSDIYVRYANANVVHLGDTFSNGIYPYIDGGTGGSINGMIGAVDRSLMLVDGRTKVVPGHGPLGDRASLIRFRDMLVGVRDRVQELKAAGTPLDKTIAAKPTASFDAEWGGGLLTPDRFVTLVYDTL